MQRTDHMVYATLTEIDLSALRAFAEHHGRRWKYTLANEYWYNARLWRGPTGNDNIVGSILHGLRNTHGPDWLTTFKLPDLAAIPPIAMPASTEHDLHKRRGVRG